MPRTYNASEQPRNLLEAKRLWLDEGGRENRKFLYEVRETREFTVEDILEQLAVIYQLRPEDFEKIKIKNENFGILENVEFHLKPEVSLQLFGHMVSFDFTVEGRITEGTESQVTNLSRTDYYDDGGIWAESLADYDRLAQTWKMQPRILEARVRE